jgi:hypothetical protein
VPTPYPGKQVLEAPCWRVPLRLRNRVAFPGILRWCTGQNLGPLTSERADIERYVRWLPAIDGSRRLSVVVGFYRTCVVDQLLPHSPADYVDFAMLGLLGLRIFEAYGADLGDARAQLRCGGST